MLLLVCSAPGTFQEMCAKTTQHHVDSVDLRKRGKPYDLVDTHASGFLDVGDGHHLYWEECGNPEGIPVVYIHGGPGAGCAPVHRTFFNPSRYRIVLFDQRGAGRSLPYACIHANTTKHLIDDMEALRVFLGIDRWLLFGGSWGSTLALAYGQAYPDRVLGFVLRGVFLFTRAEVDWFLNGMQHFYPEAARFFYEFLPEDERSVCLESMYRRLCDPDPAIHGPAADAWARYEDACARLVPLPFIPSIVREDGQSCSLAIARLEAHYMIHKGFIAENQLLDCLETVRHLPCHIVQGRHDVICPPRAAYALHQAWPSSALVMVPDSGHAAMEASLRSALVAAVDVFVNRLGQR